MSNSIPHIGRCLGCDRPDRLDNGVCSACLTRRGRKWAHMSNRCRTDPEFALAVFDRIATDRGREMFLAMYGRAALRGTGNTIRDARRMKQPGWEWEAELTWPPPPKGDPNCEGGGCT